MSKIKHKKEPDKSRIEEICHTYVERIEYHPKDITTIILDIEPIIREIIDQFDDKLSELDKEKLILHFVIKRNRTIFYRVKKDNTYYEKVFE